MDQERKEDANDDVTALVKDNTDENSRELINDMQEEEEEECIVTTIVQSDIDDLNTIAVEKVINGTGGNENDSGISNDVQVLGETNIRDKQYIMKCNGSCNGKEFDCSATNCNLELGLCSLCNIQQFPVGIGASLQDKVRQINRLRKAKANNSADKSDKINGDDNEFIEDSDEDEDKDDPLLSTPNEFVPIEMINGYVGPANNLEIVNLMLSAKMLHQTFSVHISNAKTLEFHQIPDPEAQLIEGKHGWFTLLIDPYNLQRERKLVMYGYDLFDGLVSGAFGLLCLCRIINEDDSMSPYILFKIGKTRCVKPRADGFLYNTYYKR